MATQPLPAAVVVPQPRRLRAELMGRVRYGPMLALQQARHAEVLAGEADDTLFVLEHEPVVTLGRNSGAGHLLVSEALLAARGVELCATGRGGDVTYHGPGQLVAYPIVKLRPGEQDVRGYVWRLEEIMIRTAADFGVRAERVEGKRGVWVGEAKLGAVGVRIAQWTTLHGLALNVAAGLDGFSLIVPCGLAGCRVVSLNDLVTEPVAVAAVAERLMVHAAVVLERTLTRDPTSTLPVAPPARELEVHA